MVLGNKKKWRALAALSITLVAGLAMSACSSGGGNSSAAGTITFRLVSAEGSGLSNYPDAQAGAKAAVQAINKAGGVNGKQIDFSFCNTRADANQSLTCARSAVSDKVDALVGSVDIYNTQSMPVLQAGGIPDIGNIITNDADTTASISYPLHGGNYGSGAAGPQLCKEAGFKKFSVVALDFAGSLAQAKLMMTTASAIGLATSDVIVVPGTGVIDYSPYAQKVKDAGIDCAYVLLGPAALTGFYKATAATGVTAQFAATVFSFGESEAQAAGAAATDGKWATSPVPSPSDLTNSVIKQYSADLDATGVASTDLVLRRSAGVNAWLSVYAAAAVAKTITGEVTPESMLAALKSTKPIDVQGVLTWDPAALGGAALGKYPHVPDAPVVALQFKAGKLVPTTIDAIKTPMQYVR